MRATVTTRPLTDDELRLGRWMLENGDPGAGAYISQLEAAEATTWRCPCGCASFNFKVRGMAGAPPGVHILGDFVFGAEADLSGAFIFESGGILSGVEVYGLAGDAPRALPNPGSLRSIGISRGAYMEHTVTRMNHRSPAFATSVAQFERFLGTHGWPTAIIWIRPGDVVRRKNRLVVQVAECAEGEHHAQAVFGRAIGAKLGVLCEAVCRDSHATFARIVRPLDATAAELQLYPDGLKFSVPVTPLHAIRLGSGLRWWLWTKMGVEWPWRDPDTEA